MAEMIMQQESLHYLLILTRDLENILIWVDVPKKEARYAAWVLERAMNFPNVCFIVVCLISKQKGMME